jgi:hypothetical protein
MLIGSFNFKTVVKTSKQADKQTNKPSKLYIVIMIISN